MAKVASNQLTFQGENPNEKIIFVLHRHPWSLFRPGLWVALTLLVLTVVLIVFKASPVTSWAFFTLLPILLSIIGRAWFTWANSLYVLTNERIMAVDQKGWFVRVVTELALDNILSINHQVKGPIATLLNFGDVSIQASGVEANDMVLVYVYDPYEAQQQIVRAKQKYHHPDHEDEE